MLVVGIWDRTGHGYTAPTKASSLCRRPFRMLKRSCLYLFHLHKEHTRKKHTQFHLFAVCGMKGTKAKKSPKVFLEVPKAFFSSVISSE